MPPLVRSAGDDSGRSVDRWIASPRRDITSVAYRQEKRRGPRWTDPHRCKSQSTFIPLLQIEQPHAIRRSQSANYEVLLCQQGRGLPSQPALLSPDEEPQPVDEGQAAHEPQSPDEERSPGEVQPVDEPQVARESQVEHEPPVARELPCSHSSE